MGLVSVAGAGMSQDADDHRHSLQVQEECETSAVVLQAAVIGHHDRITTRGMQAANHIEAGESILRVRRPEEPPKKAATL